MRFFNFPTPCTAAELLLDCYVTSYPGQVPGFAGQLTLGNVEVRWGRRVGRDVRRGIAWGDLRGCDAIGDAGQLFWTVVPRD